MINVYDQLFDLIKKLPYIPCPYAYGRINCGIFNPCAARVLRKVTDEESYYCYYIDAPIADESIAIKTTIGLISMFTCETELIEELKDLVSDTEKNKRTDRDYFLFASSRIGELIQKRDACISCIYRAEQANFDAKARKSKKKIVVRKRRKSRVGTHRPEGKGRRKKKGK